jgi:hypothetical protein
LAGSREGRLIAAITTSEVVTEEEGVKELSSERSCDRTQQQIKIVEEEEDNTVLKGRGEKLKMQNPNSFES